MLNLIFWEKYFKILIFFIEHADFNNYCLYFIFKSLDITKRDHSTLDPKKRTYILKYFFLLSQKIQVDISLQFISLIP